LNTIIDQIGIVLQWALAPFFRNVLKNHGTTSVEALLLAVKAAFQQRQLYSPLELAYISVVVFLRSIVTYDRLKNGRSLGTFKYLRCVLMLWLLLIKPNIYF